MVGFTITLRITLHRTEIVDRCPEQFLRDPLSSVLSRATEPVHARIFDIAGLLLRFLSEQLYYSTIISKNN